MLMKYRRLLVSQDYNEIYLTVAEFGSDYKDYILNRNQKSDTKKPFMTMHQYGPWRTSKQTHMQHLGWLLLAFTLQQR